MTEVTKSVELNLEESGMLCHFLLPEIIRMKDKSTQQKIRGLLGKIDTRAYVRRMEKLYDKLADANDILAGKKR